MNVLRPYQHTAVTSAIEALATHDSTLIVMPTGTGKTVVFSHFIQQGDWGRTLVLAHREELIRQAAAKIAAVTGEQPEIEMADERADMHMWKRSKVVVSSIQTQIAGTPPRMERFDPKEFGLIIIDEAHHAPAESYRRVLSHYKYSKIVGVTATPDRSDEVALGKVFASVAFVYELPDAIRDGYLVPIEQESIKVAGLDYSQCKLTAGDLNQADVARAQGNEEVLAAMVKATIAKADDKKTIIFATPGFSKEEDYRISQRVMEILNGERAESARRVAQDTPKDERSMILRDFGASRFQYLVNVGVLTEGFDEPSIEVVSIMRPTQSRALFAQMVGRGTRTLPGVIDGIPFADQRRVAIHTSKKPHVLVLDFEGNAGRHKLVHTTDILGGSFEDEVVEIATKKASEEGGDVLAHLDAAKKALDAQREEERNRRRVIAGSAVYSSDKIDPFDVFDMTPPVARGWETGGPTPAQAAMLEANGVKVHENMTKAQAGAIIAEIERRRREGKVGFKQAAQLRARGLDTDVSVGQAMNMLMQARKAVGA